MIGFGQSVPQGINYQAVARDTNGNVLVNQALTIKFSVISEITTGNVSWQEIHQDTTNTYGLFTSVIGKGISTSIGSSATFDVIDWGASNHLLKVEIDYGNGFLDMGTTAFMSVPYSLSSKYSDTALNFRGLSNYPSIDSACSAIESTDSTIQIAFATDTTNNIPSISTMLYKGANGKPYILGSPTKVDFLVNWQGNSVGGQTLNIPSNAGSAAIKTASIIYDSDMYASTGIVKYWFPMASGFITAARLENLNTKMEFNNSTGAPREISLELWITVVGSAYPAMISGLNSNRFATRISSYSFILPTGISSKYFNNNSAGGSFKLVNEIPNNGSSGQIGYFNEDDYIGVYWVIRNLSGHSSGTITVTPRRVSSINSHFNRSFLSFNAYLFTEIIEPSQN